MSNETSANPTSAIAPGGPDERQHARLPPRWSARDIAAAKRLLGEGRTLRQIARALSRSKDAVASRMRRLREIAQNHRLPAPRPEERTSCSVRPGSWSPPATAFPSRRPSPDAPAWRLCQFPLWPDGADLLHPDYGRTCGRPSIAMRSYCAEHHARCAVRCETIPTENVANDAFAP
jgi:hypothetical protein